MDNFLEYEFNTDRAQFYPQFLPNERFIQSDSNIYKNDLISKLLVHEDGYIVSVYNLPYEEAPRIFTTQWPRCIRYNRKWKVIPDYERIECRPWKFNI